jgi:hypothetical protein
MRRPRAAPYIGLAFSPLLLLSSLNVGQTLHAQAPTAGTTASAPGQQWWLCQCHILKDPSKPALGSLQYYALLPAPSNPSGHFAVYLQQKYKIVMGGAATQGSGRCERLSDDAASRANSLDMYLKAWAAGKYEAINTNWTDSPAESAAAAAAAPAAAATAQSSSGASDTFFISCSTSGGAGIDTYYTGVSEIGAKPGRSPHPPNTPGAYIGGTWMVPAVLPQTVLDHFYAYLTQKGYKFSPGSSSACDVQPTEAATKAAQHKRAYEGGGCSNCGKVVETGWRYTPGT